jgi:hypothetical protein
MASTLERLTGKILSIHVKIVNFYRKFTVFQRAAEKDLQASPYFNDVYSHLFNFAYYHAQGWRRFDSWRTSMWRSRPREFWREDIP